MKNQQLTVIRNFVPQRVAKFSEQYFLKSEGNRRSLESEPERVGLASVSEHAETK